MIEWALCRVLHLGNWYQSQQPCTFALKNFCKTYDIPLGRRLSSTDLWPFKGISIFSETNVLFLTRIQIFKMPWLLLKLLMVFSSSLQSNGNCPAQRQRCLVVLWQFCHIQKSGQNLLKPTSMSNTSAVCWQRIGEAL